jgi:uncharacterized membrane protein (DUF4010 family)
MDTIHTVGVLVAALGGTAIGLERQWSGHADGPAARFGGIRTFTLLGVVSGLSGSLWTGGAGWLAAVLLLGGVAIVGVGYAAASRRDVDATTEAAALVVMAAGVLAGMGSIQVASGIIAVMCLLLLEKTRLHALVRRIDDAELRAGMRFGVMALVVLPLLPVGPFGPLGGVRPRELWALVLFFSGLSFIGHVMRRLLGSGHGYLVSGLVGGLVSSTNVTLTFARLSRAHAASNVALALGTVAANCVLFPRVLMSAAVLNPGLAAPLATLFVAPAAVAAGVVVLGARQVGGDARGRDQHVRNPLQLSAAVQMAVLFQTVLMLVSLVRGTWGEAGVFATAAGLGLTDVDALTLSMARGTSALPVETAATAIGVGVLSNTCLKAAIAVLFGSMPFRLIVGGTLLGMIAAGLAVWVWW